MKSVQKSMKQIKLILS